MISLPWPFLGGTYDPPKDLRDLADKTQQNFDRLAQSLPDADLAGSGVLGASGFRVVAGSVSSAGTGSGAGFSAAKNATGDYTLTFPAGTFSATPAVVVMPDASSGALGAKEYAGSSASATTFRVATFNTATALGADSGFYFVAVGVR